MGRYRKSPQRTFGDPEVAVQHRPLAPESFPVRFRAICDRLLPDAIFDDLYALTGRPPIAPSAVTRLLLLQLKYGRSDREALEDLAYDLRWQYMCDLPATATDFDFTVLHYHRLRLLFGTIDRAKIAELQAQGITLETSPARRLFQAIRDAAVTLGLLDPDAVPGIDSTAVLGAAAVQDTYHLLFQAIRQLLQAAQSAQPAGLDALLARLRRPEYRDPARRKPETDWTDAAAREAILADYVHDTAVLTTALQAVADPAVQEALAQLRRLVGQDLTVHEDGAATLTQGVARDRQCSVVDPEMRHGRKSHCHPFDGYKAHVIADPTSEIITAVTTTAASAHDQEAVPALLAQYATPPPVTIGDHAYGGRTVRQTALAQGTALVTPAAPLAPYGPEAFQLDEVVGTVTCPAGITKPLSRNGQVRFPQTACRNCPHRAACRPGPRGRRLELPPGIGLVYHLHAYARTEAPRALVRQVRAATERVIRHLVTCGIRVGRYVGTLKTGLQTLLGALTHNLDRIGRHLARQSA
jgi:transposase